MTFVLLSTNVIKISKAPSIMGEEEIVLAAGVGLVTELPVYQIKLLGRQCMVASMKVHLIYLLGVDNVRMFSFLT